MHRWRSFDEQPCDHNSRVRDSEVRYQTTGVTAIQSVILLHDITFLNIMLYSEILNFTLIRIKVLCTALLPRGLFNLCDCDTTATWTFNFDTLKVIYVGTLKSMSFFFTLDGSTSSM